MALDHRSDRQTTRIISPFTLEGGVLTVRLPRRLDQTSARIYRKAIVMRLGEADHLVLDAELVESVGNVGAAMLWQVMEIAGRAGIDVEITHAGETVMAAIRTLQEAERARMVESVRRPEADVALTVASTKAVTRHTVTLRRTDKLPVRPATAASAKLPSLDQSALAKVLRFLPRFRKAS